MAEPDEVSVRVEGLRYRYDEAASFELAVDDLALRRGEKAVCVGPSGSGKTTLLHLVAGIQLPQRGRVVVGGFDWGDASDAERRRFRISRIGLVFQEFELLDHLTVRENVLLPYFVHPALVLDDRVEARLAELAGATGIAPYLGRRPRALSHGERQRVALCRALVTEPDVLLADEPTGNLDPKTTRKVLDLLLAEADRCGATLFVVTHDHSLLEAFDRVVDLGEVAGGVTP